jgi:hypothetical protein
LNQSKVWRLPIETRGSQEGFNLLLYNYYTKSKIICNRYFIEDNLLCEFRYRGGFLFMDVLRSSSIMEQGYGNVYKKVLKDKRLTEKAKLIHCYLCSYAGGGTTAFPSVSLICYDLDISENTYYTHMKYLKAYGYITAEQQQGENGQFGKNIYTLEMYPEHHEDKELIESIENKRKSPATKNCGTAPSTKKPSTVNCGTNNNSNNNILLSLWDKALKRIKKELNNAPAYSEFIEPLQPVEYENNTIIFVVTSDFHRMIIDLRYRNIIEMALKEVYKKEVNIVLRI